MIFYKTIDGLSATAKNNSELTNFCKEKQEN